MNAANLLDRLRRDFRGPIMAPGDAEYDRARRVYNGMIDKHPAAIVRCRSATDVALAVRAGVAAGALIAVRGGGHNAGGLGVCDDGLVIDLSGLRGIIADPEARTAQVGAGCTWSEVDRATHVYGMAVPCGIIGSTGVAGLTLGGGTGYLTRRFGLTIDNLLSANVVLADGAVVRASEEEHPDLFWALRGGGGNFGVVTAFEFRLNQVDEVVAGPTFWSVDRSRDILRWFRDFISEASEELYGFFAFTTVPPAPPFPPELHGKKMCAVVWCWLGSPARADEVFRAVRAQKPDIDGIQPMPFPALQSIFDPLYPPGLQMYWRAHFVREIPDAAIEEHVRYGASLPSALSLMHLYPMDGAVHRVAPQDTAFSYRDANWNEVIVGVDPDPANRERVTQWTRDYSQAVRPFALGGGYVNFLQGDEAGDRVRATYRDSYPRLVEIKRRYDLDNVFRVNHNIDPRADAAAEAAPPPASANR
jgi:FAD/FMN-containing dehydrogenase